MPEYRLRTVSGSWQPPALEWVSGDESYELSLLLDRTPEETVAIGTVARDDAGDWRLDNRSSLALPALTAPGSAGAEAALDILGDALLERLRVTVTTWPSDRTYFMRDCHLICP